MSLRSTSKIAALLLVAVVTAAPAQESAPEMSEPVRVESSPSASPDEDPREALKIWDYAMDELRRMLWDAQSDPNAQVKDSRGRTLAEDLNDHILTADVSAELEKLREEARAKEADETALGEVLDTVFPIMEAEAARSAVLSTYWHAWATVNHHRQLLEPLLPKASAPDREAIQAHLARMEKTLVDELNADLSKGPDDPGEMTQRYRGLTTEATKFYNERRVALAQQQADPGAVQLQSRKRRSVCPEPVEATEARDKPALVDGSTSLEEVYPLAAKRMDVQGPVLLRLRISEAGCMQEAAVVTSSGSEELDDAALLWVEHARYKPATKDGKAVEGSLELRVNFELE